MRSSYSSLVRRLATTLALALALLCGAPAASLLSPSPAAAGFVPVTLVDREDDAGDTRIFAENPGLSQARRRSIDLRQLVVRTAPRGRLRVVVSIKRVARSDADWDQMFFLRMRDPGTDEVYLAGFTQSSDDGGYAYNPATETTCEMDEVERRPRSDRLRVVIPADCVAPVGARVRLASVTGHFRSDAPAWSLDRMRGGRLESPELG